MACKASTACVMVLGSSYSASAELPVCTMVRPSTVVNQKGCFSRGDSTHLVLTPSTVRLPPPHVLWSCMCQEAPCMSTRRHLAVEIHSYMSSHSLSCLLCPLTCTCLLHLLAIATLLLLCPRGVSGPTASNRSASCDSPLADLHLMAASPYLCSTC